MNKRIKIIIIAISVPLAIYLWPSALGGSAEILIVQGQSMLPTILPGSLVVAKQAPEYYVGEIVVYIMKSGTGAEKIVVHRIIGQNDDGFVIMGDNNPVKDPGIYTNDDILGRVIFATPYVGDMFALLRNPLVLVMVGGGLAAVQMVQKRKKEKKERLRRIRLGLSPFEKQPQSSQKKPKKPDYTLFFAAIAFNVIVYIVLLYSISSGNKPEGDAVTGFLFRGIIPTFAATVSFAMYSVFIIGLYFLAKVYEVKTHRKEILGIKSKSSLRLLLGKETNPMLAVASFLWLLFIIMELFHLMAIAKDLGTIFD